METREKILCGVCLVLFYFVSQAFASSPLVVSPESESVVPLGLEGTSNTFFGLDTGLAISGGGTGTLNTFIGRGAGSNTTSGFVNTFVGHNAGILNTTGGGNTFMGAFAGDANTTGDNNIFVGRGAGGNNTTGAGNTFVGESAGVANSTGTSNTFIGQFAGNLNAGSGNAFVGASAGSANTTGSSNTLIGRNAGSFNQTGSGNVFVGFTAGQNETGSNKLYIDNSATSTPLIYGEFDNDKVTVNGNLEVIGPDSGLVRLSNVTTDNTAKGSRMVLRHFSNAQLPVYLFGAASTATDNFVAFGGGNTIANAATQLDLFTAPNNTTPVGIPRLTIVGNGNVGIGTQTPIQPLQMASGAHVTAGGVWTNASSREYKEDIKEIEGEKAIEAFKGLRPVTFNYRASPGESHVGFIAEEVPELVATKDRKGLSPMDIVAVLTKVVQEQQKQIKEQREKFEDQISVLKEELKEIKREMKYRGSRVMIDPSSDR